MVQFCGQFLDLIIHAQHFLNQVYSEEQKTDDTQDTDIITHRGYYLLTASVTGVREDLFLFMKTKLFTVFKTIMQAAR